MILILYGVQFTTRYKDYVIPLSTLRTGRLADQVAAAGAPIFSKKKIQKDVVSILKDVEEDEVNAASNSEGAESVEDAEEFKPETVSRRRAKMSAAERDLVDAAQDGDYVQLTDVLPPVPSKGNFDVKTIKNSLYFFS